MNENARVIDPSVLTIDARLAAALRGEPLAIGVDAADACARRARFHGVELLLLRGPAPPAPAIAAPLRQTALAFAAWEMQHRMAVAKALHALEQAGVAALVMKGTALASFLYEDPALRTRADTDLLVPPDREAEVSDALGRASFDRVPGVPSHQSTFLLTAADGTSHSLDVHWRINNSELLASAFSFDELAGRAMPLPRLAPGARGPSVIDSLLIACMHRATHRHYAYRVDGETHHDPNRLIWLYDIHLLAGRLGERDWDRLHALTGAKGLRAIVADGLAQARDRFGTLLPLRSVHSSGEAPRLESPSRYLASGPFVRTWMDLRAMTSWSARCRWLRNACLPPADYLRAKYGGEPDRCLSCLYARRALEGVWKRLRPSRT